MTVKPCCRLVLTSALLLAPIFVGPLSAQKVTLKETWPKFPRNVHSIAFAPDGKSLAVGSANKYLVKVIDISNMAVKAQVLAPGSEDSALGLVWSVAISPDGKFLAAGHWDYKVTLLDLTSGKEDAILKAHRQHQIRSVAFSPDSKTVATGSQLSQVKLFNVADRTSIASFDTEFPEGVSSVAFSPKNDLLATGGHLGVILWDMKKKEKKYLLKANSLSVAFSGEGKLLASSDAEHSIKVWDATTQKEVATLIGHSDKVRTIAFSPTQPLLASGSSDRTVKVWRVGSTKEPISLVGHSRLGEVSSVAFSPDGKLLATASRDGTVKLWNIADE